MSINKALEDCLETVDDPRTEQFHKAFIDWVRAGNVHLHRNRGRKNNREQKYTIYSRKEMNTEEYGNAKRSRWQIENALHWVLDIAYREDESRVRAGNSAENLNILRHMTLNMLKQEKSCKRGIAGKRKNCGWNHEYLLKILKTLDVKKEKTKFPKSGYIYRETR